MFFRSSFVSRRGRLGETFRWCSTCAERKRLIASRIVQHLFLSTGMWSPPTGAWPVAARWLAASHVNHDAPSCRQRAATSLAGRGVGQKVGTRRSVEECRRCWESDQRHHAASIPHQETTRAEENVESGGDGDRRRPDDDKRQRRQCGGRRVTGARWSEQVWQ